MRLFVHFLVSCDLTRVHCGSAVIKSKNCHRCISPLLFMRLLENYLSRMAGKCCSTLKVTFAFKSVIIQHVQIKVATYFCVITKVAKRLHVYMCSVALYISIYMCVYIYIYIYIYTHTYGLIVVCIDGKKYITDNEPQRGTEMSINVIYSIRHA